MSQKAVYDDYDEFTPLGDGNYESSNYSFPVE